jgi:iron complex transport system substrate-binding protein
MPPKHQDTKIHKMNNIHFIFLEIFGALELWWQNITFRFVSKIISKNTNLKIYLFVSLLFILASSCSFHQEERKSATISKSVKYAKGFTLESNERFKKLTVLNPWDNFKPYATYYVLKDSIKPEVENNELTFYFYETPKTIALHTAAQAASLKSLDLDKYVNGITDPRFFYEKQYSEKLDSNQLIQTSNTVQINKERILLLQPDIVITSGWNNINSDYQLLIKMGFNPLFMIEWMETEPLGKAEWIKAIALLFDKEKEADSLFNLVETNYLAIKNKYSGNLEKPKVLHGEEYNGVWYVAGGQSYIANIYADAGAEYIWKENDKSGSLVLDVEVVLEKGVDADFWFTTFGQNSTDINHIKQEKYSVLKSIKNENIYSNTNRTRILGGNDFWETGNFRPDLILKDIVQILNQENSTNDSLFFYRKLNLK